MNKYTCVYSACMCIKVRILKQLDAGLKALHHRFSEALHSVEFRTQQAQIAASCVKLACSHLRKIYCRLIILL